MKRTEQAAPAPATNLGRTALNNFNQLITSPIKLQVYMSWLSCICSNRPNNSMQALTFREHHRLLTAANIFRRLSMSESKNLPSSNSAKSQRQHILNHLRTVGSLTTLGARQKLGICHPGMRVCELRKSGHRIETHWCNDISSAGTTHRVARYVLQPATQPLLPVMDDGGV